MFTVEQMAQIAHIVAIVTRQQPQPPSPPPREVPKEPKRSIERAHKLGANPYDGSGDPKAAWLWLDDECVKHSGYTRVCLTFLALFYI